MRKFFGEEERSAEVQKNLAPAFDLAEALFNFWLMQEKDEHVDKSTLPPLTKYLAMMLDVQACRLFRSVVAECRRSEGFTASILSRSLFETILGVAFLLMKRVRIIVDPKLPSGTAGALKFDAKASSRGVKPGRKDALSRELRANLYYAHSLFEDQERSIQRVGKFPGNKWRVKRLLKAIDPGLIAEQEKAIGPEWSYILRHRPHSYSGLSVEDLARVLHKSFSAWYETIYRFQSRAVHANDPLTHVEISDGITLKAMYLSSDLQVYESLRTAITMFFVHIGLLHRNIGFGPQVNIACDSFKRKFDRLSWRRAACHGQ
jgi:hypothetical protein